MLDVLVVTLLWLVFVVGAMFFMALATLPLWWRFFKSWAADQRFFFAKLKENSALGLQKNEALTHMAIRLTPEHYDFLNELYEGHLPFFKNEAVDVPYSEYVKNPVASLKPNYTYIGEDGIVYVGPPWFRYKTVREWFFTPTHRLALKSGSEDIKGAHTIPMTIQTTSFGMIDPEETSPDGKSMRDKFEARMKEVIDDPQKKLNPSEEWMLLVLDVPETADGYSVPVKMELDWMIGAPMEAQTRPGKDNIGVLLLSHLNAAVRKAMKDLPALEVSGENADSASATSAIQSKLEQKVWMQLGYNSDGTSGGKWYSRITKTEQSLQLVGDNEETALETVNGHSPLAILARYGLLVLRARVADVRLPRSLKEQLKKPTEARAEMSRKLIDATARVKVAEKDKEALKLKGEGEQEFAKAVAKGDRARSMAWVVGDDENTKKLTEEAVAARLQSQSLETYKDAVAVSGSPVIVGTPGAPLDPASSLAGGLTQLGLGLGNRPKPVVKPGASKDSESKDKPSEGNDATK